MVTRAQLETRVGAIYTAEGNYAPPTQGQYGDLHMTQFLPPYARLALEGALFAIDMSGGTAKAPVTAMPTTSPEWGLYNASSDKHMIVLRAICNLASGTAGLGLSICGTVAIGQQTAVSADYTGTVKSCLNGSQGQPDVWLANNPTLIGGTPAWHAFEGTKVNTVGTNSVGDTLVAKIDGMLVAPPNGYMAAFEVVGETGTTALYDVQFIVAMLKL